MNIELLITAVEFLVLGAFVGFFAGIFGIGGGMVFVPFATTYLISIGIDTDLALKAAIATSLATIIFTASSSSWTHFRLGNVIVGALPWLIPGLIIGVFIGAYLVNLAPGWLLSILISAFLMISAIQIYFNYFPKLKNPPSQFVYFSFGSILGILSSIFGIGGGSFMVPFLKCFQFDIKKCIGTSACCGLPIAVFGTISFSILTDTPDNFPAYSYGYIIWPMALVTAGASIPASRFGALTAHNLSSNMATKLFAVYSLLVALYMIYLTYIEITSTYLL